MKKTVVITAGGTSEQIDSVRKITNNGSGRLGAMIAAAFLKREDVENVIYIHSRKSFMPQFDIRLVDIVADSTMEVKQAVEGTLKRYNVDIFVHSMAISDYMVDYVSTAELLAQNMSNKFARPTENEIVNVLKSPSLRLDNKDKISSSEDNLMVMLKPTPKIIHLIKEISPETKLIGFKLLSDVTKDELISVASKLLSKNNCDYVIANDLTQIDSQKHIAYLVKDDKAIKTMQTKEEISETIANLY